MVVGIDGSAASEVVLDFALEIATRRGLGVTVVHASPRSSSLYTGLAGDLEVTMSTDKALASDELKPLVEILGAAFTRYPRAEVTTRVVTGRPGPSLVTESAGASLLVVGSHGYGGFRGLLLGSVSQYALHHAHGTVAIVRPT